MEEKINISVDLGDDGFFSDSSVISHNPIKFFLDFKQMTPRVQEDGRLQAVIKRKVIILDPVHAKMFLNSLKDNLDKYEKQFGKIQIPAKKEEKQVKEVAGVSYIG